MTSHFRDNLLIWVFACDARSKRESPPPLIQALEKQT